MKKLGALLRDADPLRDAPSLPTADAREIRRRVLGAAEMPPVVSFQRALPIAALVAMMIVAGMAAGRRFADQRLREEGAQPPRADAERRQVQFATPGGTRIIWTFDPDFRMRGTLP